MKTRTIIQLILLSFILFSCQKEFTTPRNTIDLKGKIQKGPFINGSSVLITVLDDELNQTGLIYSSRVMNNDGSYELQQLKFNQFIEITANGYYLNEVTGNLSNSPIILTQLTDCSDSIFNVNIMTHLTNDRIRSLLKSGMDFKDAKHQAETEILKIFSLDSLTINDFSNLDISNGGDGDAILLAISSIFLNLKSEAEVTQFMANVINDIKDDGTLDDPELGSILLSSARYLNTEGVKLNLESHYSASETDVTIPDLEKYVQLFTENTNYQPAPFFGATGDYGDNILYQRDGFIFKASTGLNNGSQLVGAPEFQYSFSAYVPKDFNLRIRLTRLEGKEYWYYAGNYGWKITKFDETEYFQDFTAKYFDTKIDLKIVFGNSPSKFKIEFFENNSEQPTRTKILSWQ